MLRSAEEEEEGLIDAGAHPAGAGASLRRLFFWQARFRLTAGLGFHGFGVALGDDVPIDDIGYGLEVIGAFILIFQIVGVFPNVDPQQRDMTGGERGVLIGGGGHGDGFFGWIEDEPDPTGAEDFASFVEVFGHGGISRPEGGTEGVFEVAGRLGGCGGEGIPEQIVVKVATAVIANSGADFFGHGLQIREPSV